MKEDIEKLRGKIQHLEEKFQGQLKKLRTNARHNKARIKRLQLLANYVLAAMSEEDYDSDPMIDRAFKKCDKAGDLG